jgi:hypothetical protein
VREASSLHPPPLPLIYHPSPHHALTHARTHAPTHRDKETLLCAIGRTQPPRKLSLVPIQAHPPHFLLDFSRLSDDRLESPLKTPLNLACDATTRRSASGEAPCTPVPAFTIFTLPKGQINRFPILLLEPHIRSSGPTSSRRLRSSAQFLSPPSPQHPPSSFPRTFIAPAYEPLTTYDSVAFKTRQLQLFHTYAILIPNNSFTA